MIVMPPKPETGSSAFDSSSSRGAALIAVLWVTSLLAVMTAGFAQNGRSEAALARNALESAKARLLAEAGVHAALFMLLRSEAEGASIAIADRSFALARGEVRMIVTDEDGKIDLNAAPKDLLAQLSIGLGIAASSADRIAEDIALNRPVNRVDDLIDLPDVDDAVLAALRPHVTVHSGLETVAPEAASDAVLAALPGSSADLAASLRREGQDSSALAALPDKMRQAIEDHLLSSRALVFGIEAAGWSDRGSADGAIFVRSTTVALERSERGRPFTVYSWEQGDRNGFDRTSAAYGAPP